MHVFGIKMRSVLFNELKHVLMSQKLTENTTHTIFSLLRAKTVWFTVHHHDCLCFDNSNNIQFTDLN